MRVAWLDQHPERVIELLEFLKDDPTTLVRRSVANNLNDLSKVHRELTLRTCEAWLGGDRRPLIEHALRSAVKRADPGALRLLGFGGKPAVAIERARFTPKRVAIGDRVAIAFDLRSTSRTSQELLVDLVVHFIKANGRGSPKTFKLKRLALAAGKTARLERSISLAVHTTRKPRPGRHLVDILINGQAQRAGEFVVVGG